MKKNPVNTENYEDEMFERDDELNAKQQQNRRDSSNMDGNSKTGKIGANGGYQIPNDYEESNTNQMQQSQQINSAHQESSSSHTIAQQQKQLAEQQTPKSGNSQGVGYPVPKPIGGYNGNMGQGNRPATQASKVRQNAGRVGQQDLIYNPNVVVNGRQGSSNRPTTQGAFLPSNFNATGYDPTMQSSLTYASQQANQFQMTSFNRKNSDKPPINNYMHSNSSQRQQYSVDKDPRGRRQFIAQILKMQNNSATDVTNLGGPMSMLMGGPDGQSPIKQTAGRREASNNSIMNLKRKKIKELLFGAASRTNYQGLNIVEKEELQHEKRTLKVQNNVMKDENLRLKTKVSTLQGELTKKDKDIEQLSIQLQQSMMHGPSNPQVKDTIFESFLVSQLKKQNREMKLELEDKDQTIDKLRKDIKLSKAAEMESELQTYIEECGRLRAMLEAYMFSNPQAQLMPQQQQPIVVQQQQENYVIKEQARIEEAFYEKEMQIQQEQENRHQLTQQLMAEKEQRQKIERKLSIAEVKLKKFNQITQENKRKQQVIGDKNLELQKAQVEVEQLRDKAKERDQVLQKNKELVTKYYGLQGGIDAREKKIQELQNKNNELQEEIRKLQKSSQLQTSPPKSQPSSKPSSTIPKPQASSATQQQQTTSSVLTSYTPTQVELLYRGIKNLPMLNQSDNMAFKNYYNNSKALIQKELDYLKKLDFKAQIMDKLRLKREILEKVSTMNGYTEVDKFLEVSIQISDKEQRKYAIFQLILPQSESLSAIKMTGLLNIIKNTSEIPEVSSKDEDSNLNKSLLKPTPAIEEQVYESVNTVRVNESIVEANAQFQPPNEMLEKTPMSETSAKKKKKNESHYKKEDVPNITVSHHQDDAGYDNEDFEKEADTNNNVSQVKAQNEKSPQLRGSGDEEEEDYQEDEEGAAEDEKSQSIQITEEQMLDIAEAVFQTMADKLKALNLTVKQAFAKNYQILDEFEGDTNVMIISAQDFLETLRSPLEIVQLSELEIACLMRVLSKPEINHSIVLGELNLVLENFGVPQADLAEQEEEPEALKEEVEKKKQRQTKKKLIKSIINSDANSDLFQTLATILSKFDFDVEVFMSLLQPKQYEQIVKSKKKELKLELIKREDFFSIVQENTDINLVQDHLLTLQLQEALQIDAKYTDIYQIKSISQMMDEVRLKVEKEQHDRKVMEEFYQPGEGEDQQEDAHTSIKSGNAPKVEVMNFENFMGGEEEQNEEEDYYTGEAAGAPHEQASGHHSHHSSQYQHHVSHSKKQSTLNEIAEEDAKEEDQSSPNLRNISL